MFYVIRWWSHVNDILNSQWSLGISFFSQKSQSWEMADEKEVEKTIAEDLVVTKYKLAGQIVNRKLIKYTFS